MATADELRRQLAEFDKDAAYWYRCALDALDQYEIIQQERQDFLTAYPYLESAAMPDSR